MTKNATTQPELFSSTKPSPARGGRETMNGKPVFSVPSKTVINFDSGFSHKLLCDGPTFSTGMACAYSCSFCYVPDMMRKMVPWLEQHGADGAHEDIVVRRLNALGIMRQQLTDRNGSPKFNGPEQQGRVIYASPSVDVAANMELVRETVEACALILQLTRWDIRLLSKSTLLPQVAEGLDAHPIAGKLKPRSRVIYGVSTGTLNDPLAKAFEAGTPLVSKRIASLHKLQDAGHRTYGMLCPSLPQAGDDYSSMAREMRDAIRPDKCEHVWGEVINVRGESMTRTVDALRGGGFTDNASALLAVSGDGARWEAYARATFESHVSAGYAPGQFRFLQYVNASNREWWKARENIGAILL